MIETISVDGLEADLYKIFDYLHENPEVSWKEFNTTNYVVKIFQQEGADVITTFEDSPGLVAEIGDGPITVGIRADMDALWQEVDGVWRANHSCGHDAHMTLALGVFLTLKKIRTSLPGKVKFIFQPSEEKGDGALAMIEKGVVDDVDYLYGVHLRPETEVGNGKATPAIIHGAGSSIAGKISGEDGHGGRPHLQPNAIEVGADLVNHLRGIRLDPMVPYSVKMTKFRAGGNNSNIIPGSAEFSLDLRAQTNQVMTLLKDKVEKVLSAISNLYGVEINYKYTSSGVAAKVDEEAKDIMAEAIQQSIGAENVLPPSLTPGGEDFHFYSVKRPKVKATMLGLGCGLTPGLHHPKMTFDRKALIAGTEILTRAIMLTFKKNGFDMMDKCKGQTLYQR
ncbi:amidohydrolase [Bacillus thermophilus]|uniref:Amidohydrolase n=1 Tax=Siminovitchia thermophila TaxID=1245522 RepID=A0ABS2R356_9BACI|nr:M20 peptidase aminoacylase family protein [Siminovitchia thermophila]MBM7714068.1 amidohydrolase [Siminovitchia thermophila]ONK21665.1 amidohydrolase [Bacillus sp. VT-16-64]